MPPRSHSAQKAFFEEFSKLYPHPPSENLTDCLWLSTTLRYKKSTIKLRLPEGLPLQHLTYYLHLELYRHLYVENPKTALSRTVQVIGFESANGDLLFDYQLSIGRGVLTHKLDLVCLEFSNAGGLSKYKICKCLAIGGFSKVYLVRSLRDGRFYAMKAMLKKFIHENEKEQVVANEKKICSNLNHPFVVRMTHCFETDNFFCFIMEFCPGGELFFYLKTVKCMSEEDARFYFIEILYGLMYLHQRQIIYRDLKPQNLLIDHNGHVKIADFGLSKQGLGQREVTYSFCGSTEYMPPEMITRSGHSYGMDLYALGAMLYELVTGLPPFYSRDEAKLKDAIVNEELTFPSHVSLSSEIASLLRGLLHKNPKMRIGSMCGIREIVAHPWLGKLDAESILAKRMTPPYIPNINTFNFDENELGQDEELFTQLLKTDSTKPPLQEKSSSNDFELNNEEPLPERLTSLLFQQHIQQQKQRKPAIVKRSQKKKVSLEHIRRHESSSLVRKKPTSPYLLEALRSSSRSNHPSISTRVSVDRNKGSIYLPRTNSSRTLNQKVSQSFFKNSGFVKKDMARDKTMYVASSPPKPTKKKRCYDVLEHIRV